MVEIIIKTQQFTKNFNFYADIFMGTVPHYAKALKRCGTAFFLFLGSVPRYARVLKRQSINKFQYTTKQTFYSLVY